VQRPVSQPASRPAVQPAARPARMGPPRGMNRPAVRRR
jgi:hypothetical protein